MNYFIKPIVAICFLSVCFCSRFFFNSQSESSNQVKWTDPQLFYGFGPTRQYSLLGFNTEKYNHSYNNFFLKTNNRLEFKNLNRIRAYLLGSVGIIFSDFIVFQNDYEFDSNGAEDFHWDGTLRETSGKWTGYLTHSSVTIDYLNGHLLLGRGNTFLQGFSNSLLLNKNIPPRFNIWWNLYKNNLTFDWGIIFLDKVDNYLYNRLFTFHRYSIKAETFHIGFTEALLTRYYDFSEVTKYLLPSSSLFEVEVNNSGGNLFWMVDGFYKFNRYYFFLEILVDDFSLDMQSPHKIAYKFGIRSDFSNLKLILEYVNVDRWVGNYFYPSLRLVENNLRIGHEIGPDAHQISCKANVYIAEKLICNLEFSLIEKGGGSIFESWPVNSENFNFGYNFEDFPSGDKYLISFINIYFRYNMNNYFYLDGGLTVSGMDSGKIYNNKLINDQVSITIGINY